MHYRQFKLSKGECYESPWGRSFSAYMVRREYQILRKIVRKLFPGKVPRFLDFACGSGRILSFMQNRATAGYGVDISDSLIEQAKRRCNNSHFHFGTIAKVNLKELEPFHLVTAFRYFGNVHDEIRSSVFSKLSDCMVDGGYLIFNNHRNPWSAISVSKRFGNFLDNYADLSYLKIKRHLKQAKLRIVRIYGIGGWLLTPRMNKSSICSSKLVHYLEPLCLLPFVGPFCPDMIIVAQKKSS